MTIAKNHSRLRGCSASYTSVGKHYLLKFHTSLKFSIDVKIGS